MYRGICVCELQIYAFLLYDFGILKLASKQLTCLSYSILRGLGLWMLAVR